jgi:hypothetical protein
MDFTTFYSLNIMLDYILNPHQGNLLPGTTSAVKVYVEATKGVVDKSKRLTLPPDNAIETKAHCMNASHMNDCKGLVNAPYRYVVNDTHLNIINILEQPEQSVMEMICVQADITRNRVDNIARTVESDTLNDSDPENVAADRITSQKRVRTELISVWIDR